MPVISFLTRWIFWSLFHVISITFVQKHVLALSFFFLNNSLFGQTDRFPNTFHFSGTLLPSCVNRRYNSNVTRCLIYLKILHYKVLQDACRPYI